MEEWHEKMIPLMYVDTLGFVVVFFTIDMGMGHESAEKMSDVY